MVKNQEGTRVDNGSMWYFSRQSREVTVDYSFKWDPGSHLSNEVNDPLQLVVMQPLYHAILYHVTIGCRPPSLPLNAPRGIYSDCKGGHDANAPRNDGAKICLCAAEDGAQVPGPKLVEARRSLYTWRN